MSSPRPLEVEYLASAEDALSALVGTGPANFEFRLQVLEAASARFGGFDLEVFHEVFGVKNKYSASELLELATPVVDAIKRSPIQPALALSALAREALHEGVRKSTGAYHTDFRLATRLAQLAAPRLTHKSKVIDPACGAGILLAALTNAVCGMDRTKVTYWLANSVCAADLSPNSLRAALLSLASFTDDVEALKSMRTRWYCGDSLTAHHNIWAVMAPEGFDAVIGNPPWEKVKLSRHEFLKSSGEYRHYGAQIDSLDEERFAVKRAEIASYSQLLLRRYPDLGKGEPDLYIAFTNLFFELCKEGGAIAVLVPGGLIRSQGTETIRRKIFDCSQNISLSIIDNRARFFSIDTRFKFLAMSLVKSVSNKEKCISLLHEQGTPSGLEVTGSAIIDQEELASVRDNLSLPEVRNQEEWELFSKISKAGTLWDENGGGWAPKFCREVDMTKERSKFLSNASTRALPLVEGRMVHCHRLGVKGHVSGSGRRAIWEAYPIGGSSISPQFWIEPEDLPRANRHRTEILRVGFCDIAGQTNERSLMATLIPAGVACGNKVPTIIFPEDLSEERLLVWVSIANSFVFDWMIRRVLTTTVNYFLLKSIPLPRITKGSLPWNKLVTAARELRLLDDAGEGREACHRMAQLRAEIDAEVAVAYGLDLKDLELVLKDFPLLDRGQAALAGEAKSTITRDTVLSTMAKRMSNAATVWLDRMTRASAIGSVAYVPSEIAHKCKELEKKGVKAYG